MCSIQRPARAGGGQHPGGELACQHGEHRTDRDGPAAASLSAFAQGAGYLVAAAGPLMVGFLHTATGGWTVPIGAVLAVLAGQFAAGMLAARPRVLAAG